MLHATITALFIIIVSSMVIFDFSENSNLSKWHIINDAVMGGKSQSSFTIDSDGKGLFKGTVSLENNGGFCSVRYNPGKTRVKGFKKMVLHIKGDGKRYQVRIKANRNDYYSYIAYFRTSGDWETVEIQLNDMYPSFRGQRLNGPNFESDTIDEVAFLIGNKKAETFQLRLDKLTLLQN